MTDLKENIGIEENRERGETAIQLVLDKQKNETMAMYRKGVGWIAFLWGSSGTNSDFSDGFGMARIIAESEAKKKNDPSMISGRELVRSAPEVIAKGRIKRKYGPPGDRRVDIVYNQNVVTLAWDRARRTFYLNDITAKAESWILEDGMDDLVEWPSIFNPELEDLLSLRELMENDELNNNPGFILEAAGDAFVRGAQGWIKEVSTLIRKTNDLKTLKNIVKNSCAMIKQNRAAFDQSQQRTKNAADYSASQNESVKYATYKGKKYKLLYIGKTKFGQKAKLSFMDGSKEFWVDADAVNLESGSSINYEPCAECGDYKGIYDRVDSSGYRGKVCKRCSRLKSYELSFA